jgi:hypothetical protein
MAPQGTPGDAAGSALLGGLDAEPSRLTSGTAEGKVEQEQQRQV